MFAKGLMFPVEAETVLTLNYIAMKEEVKKTYLVQGTPFIINLKHIGVLLITLKCDNKELSKLSTNKWLIILPKCIESMGSTQILHNLLGMGVCILQNPEASLLGHRGNPLHGQKVHLLCSACIQKKTYKDVKKLG